MIIRTIDEFNKSVQTNDSAIECRNIKWNKNDELRGFRKETTEHYHIVDGMVWVGGEIYNSGTVLTYEPYDKRNYFPLSDVTFRTITASRHPEEDPLCFDEITLDEFLAPYQYGKKASDRRFNDIRYKDISVVLQGAVDKTFTPLAIQSVRRYLQGATIILSTWNKNDATGLDIDALIINEDPGAPSFTKPNGTVHYDNRNRLLVSTQGGITAVTTKYTLKMRSDCILMGDGVVRNYGRYPKKPGHLSIFRKKLVIGEQCNITKLRFAGLSRPYLFHVSDWFCFGLTDDVQSYFLGTPIESETQVTNWKYVRQMIIPEDDDMGKSASPRYNSEQYYLISALKRNYDIPYEDASDYSIEADKLSKEAILDNFEILNIQDHEIINAKKETKPAWRLDLVKRAEYFTNDIYERLYNERVSNTGGLSDGR